MRAASLLLAFAWFISCSVRIAQGGSSSSAAAATSGGPASRVSSCADDAPHGGNACGNYEVTNTPHTGLPGTSRERSFIAIKPDGIQRGLLGEVISRFERKGWKLVALRMLVASRPVVEEHYQEHVNKDFFDRLVAYVCSGPILAMVWEGSGVIAGSRKLLGSTNPLNAEVGTIRGDLCTNAGRNLVHASDGPESAEREISLWFRHEEIVEWSRDMDPWISKSLR